MMLATIAPRRVNNRLYRRVVQPRSVDNLDPIIEGTIEI